jgi:hypothetical protein
MKKYFLILVVGIMSGCASNQTFIKHSDVALVKGNNLYILNEGQGPLIYRMWKKGCYGDSAKVHLVNTVRFNKLCKKSIPCTCTRGNIITVKN